MYLSFQGFFKMEEQIYYYYYCHFFNCILCKIVPLTFIVFQMIVINLALIVSLFISHSIRGFFLDVALFLSEIIF